MTALFLKLFQININVYWFQIQGRRGEIYKTSRESQNVAQRTSHQLSRCQNVFTKRPLKFFFFFINLDFVKFKFCHNLSF